MATFYQPNVTDGAHFLDEEESRHAVKVLRLRQGDPITVVDGKGNYYQANLQDINPKRCSFSIVSQHSQPPLPYSVNLLIAPTKNFDRMEWMVEKLTEIGVDSIQFVECDYSERRTLKLPRLYRKAISAMKQSKRARLPVLHEMNPLSSWKASADTQNFIAHINDHHYQFLSAAAQIGQSYHILVGPEGGFSPAEVNWATERDFKMVSLGNYRLRTETAGLVACQTLHVINGLRPQ
ncbi:MAG: RsmE family RNA methyltransferase [Bacteroidota bacterium]